MTEHALLTLLSILVTITCALVGLLIGFMRAGKKELLGKIDSLCTANKEDHLDIWDRVNHHYHNGGGNVVIPATVRSNQ